MLKALDRRHRWTLAVTVVTGLLGGCSTTADPQTPPREVRGISMKPELNAATGAVVLPADRFTETRVEMDLLATASAVEISRCAASKGVTFVPPAASADPIYASEHYFGPWTAAQAERFGFVQPMTAADLEANGIVTASATSVIDGAAADADPQAGNSELSDKEWAVVAGCEDAPGVDRFTAALTQAGPWIGQFKAVQDAMLEEKESRDAVDDLVACYKKEGLQVGDRDRRWIPRGADASMISADQIRLALLVVKCKDAVEFTSRMASVEAGLQAPIVAEYADELVARRAQLDAAISEARGLGLG